MNEIELRRTIGQLFAQLPELTDATFTIGGKDYRARRAGPWACIDVKEGRRWVQWTEYPMPAFYERQRRQQ